MSDKPADDPRPPGALGSFDYWFTKVENFTNWAASVTVMMLMFLAVYQIIGRTVFNLPVFGYIDIIEQFMVIFAFAGVAFCMREGGHIRMELIIGRLGRGRVYWLVEALAIVIGMIVIGILVPVSYDHFLRAFELGDSTINVGLVVWPAKLLIPVSFVILLIRMLMQLLGYLRMVVDPSGTPVAVPLIQRVEDEAAREISEALSGGDEQSAAENGRG
ncbi:MAG: TRAP transporter small permease [Alphaproteobacteria bacterium]|jgi:TRAP-type mannitol/chloroaromatic compound transport system permease small subunit|nr:TRAP transporter small permease [Alphaproteobacteria bacterium]MDP6814627.1 TRAP transporter small permease [Alphaproteobacteria bacterium]